MQKEGPIEMTPIYVVLGILAVLLAFVVILFNQLVGKRNMVNNGWADIDVQLKRRANLIPQLVTTVQAYASHERQLFEDVIMKRNAALQAGDHPGARGSKESALAAPVGKLMALAKPPTSVMNMIARLALEPRVRVTKAKQGT